MPTSTDSGKYQPKCILAHGLVNKLSVIVGYCDIMKDDAEPGSLSEKNLTLIRDIATQMADLLSRHQCDLEFFVQDTVKKSSEGVPLQVRTSNSA